MTGSAELFVLGARGSITTARIEFVRDGIPATGTARRVSVGRTSDTSNGPDRPDRVVTDPEEHCDRANAARRLMRIGF
jgi:hypothetical protein